MDITADQFNAKYSVGTPVKYWPGWRTVDGKPGSREIPPQISKTSTPAWEMPGGQQVVTVEGRTGGMWLQHVEVIDQDVEEAEWIKAQFQLAAVGVAVEQHMGDLLRMLEPYYKPKTTTCDGKCATAEDWEDKAGEWERECMKRGAEADRLQERAEEAEAETERVSREFRRLTEESAQRQAEIDRLRGVLRLNQLHLDRERDNLTVFRGVIGQKEQELAVAKERVEELLALREEDQGGKVEELRGMLATQHARLTTLEGDLGDAVRKNNEALEELRQEQGKNLDLQNSLTEARQKLDIAEQDLDNAESERERMYSMLDPNTEIDDRVKSLPALVEELIAENQRLEREIREKPHKGCRELEAGLQEKLTAAERGEELTKERLRVAEGSLETYMVAAERLARGWDGARLELQGLRMQIQSYEEAPEKASD